MWFSLSVFLVLIHIFLVLGWSRRGCSSVTSRAWLGLAGLVTVGWYLTDHYITSYSDDL